jgi:hypothetical protein
MFTVSRFQENAGAGKKKRTAIKSIESTFYTLLKRKQSTSSNRTLTAPPL